MSWTENDEMKIFVCAAIVGAAVWWAHRQWAARPRGDELGRVVAQAYAGEWTDRFGVTAEALHAALAEGDDPVLRERIDQAIGAVDLSFAKGPEGTVAATVVVIDDNGRRSTARLSLRWDDVPESVRAELLRDGTGPSVRSWRAVA
ncbi:hypothetical protein BZB76_2825 [Actinomadura pelletieri DSM 43383]|uniref:Uncharacterized protein n=1 Tax=Actinomadura pelletieri DSM 43383 TaxID=1120940 RepID=A0A495QMX4_9ACTN|nr:hypothetical protein [Actinomadura pelletieri]RKS74314.1 hypothetical protein BZB76_2825 [Actinomadura pelletieri DSM 43383]